MKKHAVQSTTFRAMAAFGLFLSVVPSVQAEAKLKALIVDGQNNHAVWPKSTIMMKQYLEGTGLFEVDVVGNELPNV